MKEDRILKRGTLRIAMIYRELHTCGGIQRGASFQVGQFREWGYEPIVLSEKELGDDECRMARLTDIIRIQKVDCIIEHDCYVESRFTADIAAARAAGVPIITFWHSVFSWMFIQGRDCADRVMHLLRTTDAVIALSKTDEAFFRMLGCRSLAIPYCDPDIMTGFLRREHPHRIVWTGRLCAAKFPLDAIKIVERIRTAVPDVELFMLGNGLPAIETELRSYLDARPELRQAVHLEGFQRDVRPYLEAAGVGLLTSKFEGWCHSLVEMKMAALPIVAYKLDYLETCAPGSGVVQVSQRDIEAAAQAIISLFSDPAECARQAAAARLSYEKLSSFDQREAYENLFEDLRKPRSESSLTAVKAADMSKVLLLFSEHSVAGFERVKERTAAALWKNQRIVKCIRAKLKGVLSRIGNIIHKLKKVL